MVRRSVLIGALLALAVAAGAVPAQANGPDWQRTWGRGNDAAGVFHVQGPPEENAIIVGRPGGWEVISRDPEGSPLTEDHLRAFCDAMDELEQAFAAELAHGSYGHAQLGSAAAGIVLGDATRVFDPNGNIAWDIAVAQVWQNVHQAYPHTVPQNPRVIVDESRPGPTETLDSLGDQLSDWFDSTGHQRPGDSALDAGWTPPSTIGDLIDLLRNPPSQPVTPPDGSTIFPVPVVPMPVPAVLAPGPWVPVPPTIAAPPGAITPAPAGLPAAAPAGVWLRPLNEMATDFFVPVIDWDISGVTGTGQQEGTGGGEEPACSEDQICPGDPAYPADPPQGGQDDEGGCLGWRECSAVGGGQPTSIYQPGETGCGIAHCEVEVELPRAGQTGGALPRSP
jgi:hypothetical protein